MQNVLILGNNQISKIVKQRLDNLDEYNVIIFNRSDFNHAENYKSFIKDINIIYSFIGPMDVDLAFEALFDAIAAVKPPLKQFIMLSSAGIDDEVNGKLNHPGVNDLKEYINEQRYAIKLVDEEEINYTILRPVNLISDTKGKINIIPEGQRMSVGEVSYYDVAKVALEIVVKQRYINQSIGIIEDK